MHTLKSWPIWHRGILRKIDLCYGDLAELSQDEVIDILVVSAFPNDYSPTPKSLIGALHGRGISVAALSKDKAIDMREDFACWISKPIDSSLPIRQILCIESGWLGTPLELADDIFRSLGPASIQCPQGTIAVPLIGAGDQGYNPQAVLEALVKAAAAWLRRGLSVSTVKIVIHSPDLVRALGKKFSEMQYADVSDKNSSACDVFLSYSRKDTQHARSLIARLGSAKPGIRMFFDQDLLKPGMSWLTTIADSLDSAKRVVALYSPDYWSSSSCKDEFNAAFIRQVDCKSQVLFPIYLRTAHIPYLFRSIQYVDCRESDESKITGAAQTLCNALDQVD